MRLVSSLFGGACVAFFVSMVGLGACGGDNSVVPTGSGGSNASVGGSNPGGMSGTDTSVGGTNNTGGTSGVSSTNPYNWTFYADSEGWQTGIYPSDGTMTGTGSATNVKGQSFCDGGCADITATFNGDSSQAVNFMHYWSSTVNFTGCTLTANVKVTDNSGVISAIDFHAQNGSPNYTWSATANFTATSTPSLGDVISSTTAVTISVTLPASASDGGSSFDPSTIQGIGFNIAATSGASGTADLYVDSVSVTCP